MDFQNKSFVGFELGGQLFEYDQDKNEANIRKHGISFRNAAHVFLDYDAIILYDEGHSSFENRFNIIGELNTDNDRFGSAKTFRLGVQEKAILFLWCVQKEST